MARRAPSNQHSSETQGLHLSCLLILRMPAKCLLLWRGCVHVLKNGVWGLVFHQLQFPILCLIHSPPNPSSSQERKDVYSTDPFPKLCSLRMVSCVHLCLSVGRIGYMWAHVPVYPQNTHSPLIKDCDAVKSSKPSKHGCHSSFVPSLSHYGCVCLLR